MAYEFYVTIEGSKQGKFKGESRRESLKDKLVAIGFTYEVKVPRDEATGFPAGKRQHSPVTITREWGPASPQLLQALVTNETLKSVLIEFMRASNEGAEHVHYTVKLTNASVSEIKQYVDLSSRNPAASFPELEDVSFTFEHLDVEHKLAKTSVSDDWRSA